MGFSPLVLAIAVVAVLLPNARAQACGAAAGASCTTIEVRPIGCSSIWNAFLNFILFSLSLSLLQDNCCSGFFFCGGTADHCGVGCLPDYSYGGECRVMPTPNVTVVTQCISPYQVAITFDDGPFQFTAAVSKAFSDAGGFVTFFVNGINREWVQSLSPNPACPCPSYCRATFLPPFPR